MDELAKLGYIMSFSAPCPIAAWGKWHVSFYIPNGARVAGYGETETDAVAEALNLALKTAQLIEENKALQNH